MAILEAATPVILQLILLGLKYFNANQELVASFSTLVQNSHNEGLITVDTRNIFLQQQQDLLNQLNAKV